MYLYFDSILMYLEHHKVPCTFVLRDGKSVKGRVIGREKYMIFVQAQEKQHFLFKQNIIDVIPTEILDLEAIKNTFKTKEENLQLNR